MLVFYRISVWLYGFIIWLIAPFYERAKRFCRGRQSLFQELEETLKRDHRKLVWMHAASLGEFEQGRPILEEIRSLYPKIQLLVTFFSPSGYEVRKNHPLADYTFYLPLDGPGKAACFLDIVKPDLAIFVKYEFWYYYLVELEQRSIPILMTSAIFRKNQMFFHWLAKPYLPALRAVTHYFLQDERSAALLRLIGVRNCTVAGDTRFDRVMELTCSAREEANVEAFVGSSKVMILGSVWPSDMFFMSSFIKNHQGDLKFVIAPHTIDEEALASFDQLGNSIRYSEISKQNLSNYEIMIIDNVGMLSELYRYADYAYVGGGFRGALHNLLEAAAFGVPVFFGKHALNEKFLEAGGLEDCGGAFSFEDLDELEEVFQPLWTDSLVYEKARNEARNYVVSHSGSTKKVMEKINEIL